MIQIEFQHAWTNLRFSLTYISLLPSLSFFIGPLRHRRLLIYVLKQRKTLENLINFKWIFYFNFSWFRIVWRCQRSAREEDKRETLKISASRGVSPVSKLLTAHPPKTLTNKKKRIKRKTSFCTPRCCLAFLCSIIVRMWCLKHEKILQVFNGNFSSRLGCVKSDLRVGWGNPLWIFLGKVDYSWQSRLKLDWLCVNK